MSLLWPQLGCNLTLCAEGLFALGSGVFEMAGRKTTTGRTVPAGQLHVWGCLWSAYHSPPVSIWSGKKQKKCVSVDLIALGGFLPVQQSTEMGPVK